ADWYSGFASDRTFVQLPAEQRGYRDWLHGIQHGRTFASNGPLMALAVDGSLPGAEVSVQKGRVTVTAMSWAQHPRNRLDLIHNGQVVAFAENKGGKLELNLDCRVNVDRDGWLAARCHGVAGPERTGGVIPWNMYGHTSPVYLRHDGRGVVDPSD